MKKWTVTAESQDDSIKISDRDFHVIRYKYQWIICCENEKIAKEVMIVRTRNFVPPGSIWSVEEYKGQ